MVHVSPMMGNADYTALLADLDSLVNAGELLMEDFALIHARFSRLRSDGWSFPEEFILLMTLLEIQARDSDDDADSDRCVEDQQEDEAAPTSYPTDAFISSDEPTNEPAISFERRLA